MPSIKTLPLVKDAERLESRLKEIPAVPGVYLMRDEAIASFTLANQKNSETASVPTSAKAKISVPASR